MSWRDTTPQPVQNDLDLLLSHGLDQADQLLARQGEFYPFALHTGPEGLAATMTDLDVGANPSGEELMAALVAGLRKQRNTIRGAATVVPVSLEDGGDAVCVQLEHRDGGPSMVVLRAYSVARAGHSVKHGAMQAQEVEPRIWTG